MKWPELWNSPHQANLAQQEWTAALDVVDISIFLSDAQFRILRCNRAFQQRAGIPFQQIIGRPYYEVFPKTGSPLPCYLRVMGKTENSACEEDVAIGEAIYRSRAFSAHDGQGAFLYSVHIIEDVTERRHAELALHDNELRFRQMDQMIDEVLWMASPDAQSILYISHAFEKLWGRPCADLYARPHLWFEMIHPDDAPRVQQARDALAQGVAYNIDFRNLRPDGAERWINDRGYALRDGVGQVILISGISLDITERKRLETVLLESEARFRALADAAGDLIFTVAADGEVGYVNAMIARALQTTPEQMIGKRLRDLFPPDIYEQKWRDLQKVFETGEPLYVEEPNHFPHGEVWQGTWLTPLRDASGSVVAVLGASRDITERKLAEQEVKLQRDNFMRVLNAMTDGIYVVNRDGDIEYVNSVIEREFGKVGGRKCYTYFHDRTEPCPWCKNDDVFKGNTVRWEWHSDKTGKTYDLLDTPITNSDGTVSKLEMFHDITEIKRTEEKLRASEQKFMRFFMDVPIPLGVADKEGVIIYFNRKFTEVFGYTVDNVPTLNEWWLKAYPNETYRRWVQDNWNDAVAKAAKEGTKVAPAEYNVTCKNGSERTVIIGGAPLEGDVLATFDDITERKQSEAALRDSHDKLNNLLNSIVEGAYGVDTQGNCTFVNPSCLKMLGYQNDDELLGKHMHTLMHHSHADGSPYPVTECRIYRAYQTLQSTNAADEVFWRKDGSSFPVEYWSNPIVVDGVAMGAILTFIDITERKHSEQKLRATLGEKIVLMREIHHRVKNNMQMMSALLELQSGYVTDEQARGFFKDSQQRIQSMAMIHEQLYQNESMSSIDFAAYLHSLIDNLRGQYSERCSQVNIRFDAQACTLPVDIAIPCGLVISELVSNVFKHAFPNGRAGELRIGLQYVGGKVILEVADNGVGLPAGSDIRRSKSFGLQVITLMVEEQLHGKLSVESNGHGTRVVCEIGGAK